MNAQTYPKVILPGDYPDPSIMRDGKDYYMTHSPFYYAPGFLIWHSQDLMNWEPLCRVMPQYEGSAMAPDLLKYKDTYYIYYPAAGTNWVMWAKDIRGPWSLPVDLKVGGIDPGHVVDREGNRYLYVDKGEVIRLTEDGLATVGVVYSVFRNLAIIILSAKFFGLVARKCKAPQVVGEILAGLIIGPCILNLVQTSDAISTFAEIGVVMLMFTTGLGTNLKELIKAGPIATLIACVGVAVPLVGGTLLYSAFYGFSAVGSPEFYRALFIGTIMTATSVSITVATLQEMGHLKSFLGTTIVSAAVIDDVIGIVVLTCVLGASSGTGTGLGKVLINTALFFATAVGVGVVAHFAMTWLDKRNPHTQRITIVSMAFCFAMAYIAEEYFGIADITGAYIAGIVLCTMDDASYVERRVDISNGSQDAQRDLLLFLL